jgi:hypothetical protein
MVSGFDFLFQSIETWPDAPWPRVTPRGSCTRCSPRCPCSRAPGAAKLWTLEYLRGTAYIIYIYAYRSIMYMYVLIYTYTVIYVVYICIYIDIHTYIKYIYFL